MANLDSLTIFLSKVIQEIVIQDSLSIWPLQHRQ